MNRLAATEKILFRYKLEGHDRVWQDVGNRRQAFYDDLPPGDYPFRRVAKETPHGDEVTFKTVAEGSVRELHPVVLEESFSSGREALVNALTHPDGSNVEVEITYDARQFRLRVRDDGRGIDSNFLAVLESPEHNLPDKKIGVCQNHNSRC